MNEEDEKEQEEIAPPAPAPASQEVKGKNLFEEGIIISFRPF